MPDELPDRGRDAMIARLAGRQHGVASVQQWRAAGLSRSAVSDRVNTGRLHRVHRGVYAVGHPGLSNEGRWMAAVLAYGEGAVLSHTSAAQPWRMLREPRGNREIPHDDPARREEPQRLAARFIAMLRRHRLRWPEVGSIDSSWTSSGVPSG